MKNFITILLVAFSFYSCTDSLSDNNVPQNCGDVKNVAYESFNYCGQLKEKPTQPVYVVINSNEEMQKKFTNCENTTPTLPDFAQKRILALYAEPKQTTGYGIKIQSVIENDCQILVEYYETAPKTGDGVTTAVTYPADYVVLPKSDKPILFSKVNKIIDYAVIGSYNKKCTGTDCFKFYKIENYKVINYLKVNNFPVEFNQADYKTLVYKDDLAAFILKVPTEIKNLKGQAKTFGTPDSHDQGGVYLEWSLAGVVTKVYFDTEDTTDQNSEIIAFKKIIQNKIIELKAKS